MSGVAVFAVGFVMLWNSLNQGGKVSGGSGVPSIDYCSLGSDHTMCKYTGPASGCIEQELTSEQRDEIIRLHNKLRGVVASGKESRSATGAPQPPAANMLQMKFDEGLAIVARRWAEQCTFGHDTNRKDKRFHVGQNYASKGHSSESFTLPLESMITAWYEEVAVLNPSQVSSFGGGGGAGHYTQLVWHDSEFIGCGCAKNIIHEGGFKMKNFHLVCNYGPGGNVRNQKIYEEGPACTQCPSDHSTCSNSLCS